MMGRNVTIVKTNDINNTLKTIEENFLTKNTETIDKPKAKKTKITKNSLPGSVCIGQWSLS